MRRAVCFDDRWHNLSLKEVRSIEPNPNRAIVQRLDSEVSLLLSNQSTGRDTLNRKYWKARSEHVW